MTYSSPPKTIDSLIEILLSKGLLIEDVELAKKWINQVGFYKIKTFSHIFHIPDSRGDYSFSENTLFSYIIDDYKFDCLLRSIIFDALSHIEISFKALLNYNMSINYGSHWYLKNDLFKSAFSSTTDPNFESGYDKFILKLTKDCKDSQDSSIRKYKFNFSDPSLPPSWVIMEIISFGTCSVLYQNMLSTEIRNDISSKFNTNQKFFESWLISLSYLRNQCAHHQKLIYRTFMFPPKMPSREKNIFLKEHKFIEHDSLYSVLCIIQFSIKSLKIDCFFKESLHDLIEANPQINLKELGFSQNWAEEDIWIKT